MKAMAYTYQELSESGSFAHPDGQDVKFARSLNELHRALESWAEVHARVGSNQTDACIRVWCGIVPDVTDVYPDYDLIYGPRGGMRRVPL